MTRWTSTALVVALAALASFGCTSTGEPFQRALDDATEAVIDGVEEGVETVESLDEVVVKARFNPCRCPAPDFEIRAYGRWKRVIIAGDDDVLDELRTRAERLDEALGLGYLWLEGRFDGTATFEETGLDYAQFRLVGVDER